MRAEFSGRRRIGRSVLVNALGDRLLFSVLSVWVASSGRCLPVRVGCTGYLSSWSLGSDRRWKAGSARMAVPQEQLRE